MSTGLVAPEPRRSAWQAFYGHVHRLRRQWLRRRARRLPRPVVSVGNLHWGGTGKTPVVAALALHLRDRGRRVCVLSRGYRSPGRGARLASTGAGPLVPARTVGDEPALLSRLLPGVAVCVGRDRYLAGLHALERLEEAPDLFLLDDGFSHVRLWRDLDLLVFPRADPWAGSSLPPAGRLREPLASAGDADAVLLTGAAHPAGARLAEHLRRFGFRGPGFACPVRVLSPESDTAPVPAGAALLVAGIARPERFFEAAAALDLEIAGRLRFPDHCAYGRAALEKIRRTARRCGARLVLTTSKDHVKLAGRLGFPLAHLPIRAEPPAAFWSWLDATLDGEAGPAA